MAPRPPLRIVADRNITYVEQAFADVGEVVALPSSAIDAAAVQEADLLLVRSTVKVGPALLEDSRVRFVATATIGTDHLDLPWLLGRGIEVASAPGSNAPSVALWWAAALLTTAARQGQALLGRTVGIVGVGNVGRRVEAAAVALGMKVLRCDPPRTRAEGAAGFAALDEVIAAADILTLHVPLTDEGPDRTRRLFDAARLGELRPGAWLVNACRGPVLDGAAAAAARQGGRLGALVLDVFDPEPVVPPDVVAAADIATAHIAGHSLDGKAAGTAMVYRAACAFLGQPPRWEARLALPRPSAAALSLDARELPDEAAALALVRRFYRIEPDDAALRAIAALPEAERGPRFRRFRDDYPSHREPTSVRVTTLPPRPRALALLQALGATPA